VGLLHIAIAKPGGVYRYFGTLIVVVFPGCG
jgi:hypothetical protein